MIMVGCRKGAMSTDEIIMITINVLRLVIKFLEDLSTSSYYKVVVFIVPL